MANEERVQLLVDALRSGEFNQAQGVLENEHGNCCLGVACRVAMKNGLYVKVDRHEGDPSTLFDGQGIDLPLSVQEWYGFEQYNPLLKPEDDVDGYCGAIHLNDYKKYDFNKIADAFERTFIDVDGE